MNYHWEFDDLINIHQKIPQKKEEIQTQPYPYARICQVHVVIFP